MAGENLELLRRVCEGWSRGDFSVSRGLLAEDVVCVWDEPASVMVCRGVDEMTARFKDFFAQWSSFRAEPIELAELHDGRILLTVRQHARGGESGADVLSVAYIVWTFARGEVVRMDWRFDRADALAGSAAVDPLGLQDAGLATGAPGL